MTQLPVVVMVVVVGGGGGAGVRGKHFQRKIKNG